MKIQMKLFTFCILIEVVLFAFFLFFFIDNQNTRFENEMAKANERELTQLCEKFNSELSIISHVFTSISLDQDLHATINQYKQTPSDHENTSLLYAKIEKQLLQHSRIHDGIYPGISLSLDSGDMISTSSQKHNILRLTNNQALIDELSRYHNGIWGEYQYTSKNTSVVYYARKLTPTQSNYLFIDFIPSELSKLFSGSVAEYRNIYLINSNNQIITYSDSLKLQDSVNFLHGQDFSDYNGTYEYNNTDSEYLITHRSIINPSWKIIFVSDLALQRKTLNASYQIYFLAAGIGLILFFFLSYLGSKIVTKPILNLHRKMQLVQGGDLSVRVEQFSQDEIGAMTHQFNNMLDQIEHLMDRTVKMQEMKRASDIKALQSQIHPHFLNNTLAKIRYEIMIGNNAEADKMLLSLTNLLNNILSNDYALISVQLELDYLRDYINLEKHLLAENFVYNIEIDDDLTDFLVIKLMLQPLVENSIIHGLWGTENPKLHIKCEKQGNDIVFSIKDNGCGFDVPAEMAEKLKKISSGPSIGIYNVNNRIKLHFGNKYGISIKSTKNGQNGTTVYLRIPCITAEGNGGFNESLNS